MPEIHPAVAEGLRADRDAFNERFLQRRRAGARIDDLAFQEHLCTGVSDLVGAVASVRPDRARAALHSLFDVSLDLFAAGLLGPNTKHPHVGAVWRELLPQSARLLALEPMRVAGCLSNAADHLAGQPSARAPEWIDGMRKLAPHCDAVSTWLDAGKVLAWRAGMVQYRPAALAIARTLPWQVVGRCIGAPESMNEADGRKLLDRMEADRWYAPGTANQAALRIVRTTGGFRGFGGPCLRPPTVAHSEAGLIVIDGKESWHLLADVFGTLWQRSATPIKPVKAGSASIDKGGKVKWDGASQDFVQLSEASSFACDQQTLAVTLPTSHHVFLVARGG